MAGPWKHRIDAVPDAGTVIEVRRGDEPTRRVKVVNTRYSDRYYGGCGDDRRLEPIPYAGVLLIPSKTYDYWRYVD